MRKILQTSTQLTRTSRVVGSRAVILVWRRFDHRALLRFSLLLGLIQGAVGAQRLAAQARKTTLNITSPAQWRFKTDTLKVVPGASLTIRGNASHSGGLERVVVNGVESKVSPDPENPLFRKFEITLPADSVTDVVTVRLVAKGGDFEKYMLATNSSKIGPDSPKRVIAAQAPPVIPREVTVQSEPKTPAPAIALPSVWRRNQKYNVGYGVIGAIGLIAGASGQRGLGFGLIGGAAILAGVDAAVTSKQAAARKAETKATKPN